MAWTAEDQKRLDDAVFVWLDIAQHISKAERNELQECQETLADLEPEELHFGADTADAERCMELARRMEDYRGLEAEFRRAWRYFEEKMPGLSENLGMELDVDLPWCLQNQHIPQCRDLIGGIVWVESPDPAYTQQDALDMLRSFGRITQYDDGSWTVVPYWGLWIPPIADRPKPLSDTERIELEKQERFQDEQSSITSEEAEAEFEEHQERKRLEKEAERLFDAFSIKGAAEKIQRIILPTPNFAARRRARSIRRLAPWVAGAGVAVALGAGALALKSKPKRRRKKATRGQLAGRIGLIAGGALAVLSGAAYVLAARHLPKKRKAQ